MIIDILTQDKNILLYRKEFNKVTGSVTASILLQQIIYNWNGKPFYKFKEPCEHPLYKSNVVINDDGTEVGDSWTETMGFTRSEFDNALANIAVKVKKGTDLSTIDKPVYFYTTIDRVTYYGINEPVLTKWLNMIYVKQNSALRKAEICDSVNQDSDLRNAESGDSLKLDSAVRNAESRDSISYTKNHSQNKDNKKINKKDFVYDEWVVEIFEYWKLVMKKPKAILDEKRKRIIKTRLRQFESVHDDVVGYLKKAIIGCSKSAWHMGNNPSRKLYNDISNIFGDTGKVEGFAGDADKKSGLPPANAHDLSGQSYDNAQEHFDVPINEVTF